MKPYQYQFRNKSIQCNQAKIQAQLPSVPYIDNKKQADNKKLMTYFCFMPLLFAVLVVLSGCNNVQKTKDTIEIQDDLGHIYINHDNIVVSEAHIAGMKFERYQPSLSLYGSLLPMKEHLVTSPEKMKLLDILVANNQRIPKNTTILAYKPYSSVAIDKAKKNPKHISIKPQANSENLENSEDSVTNLSADGSIPETGNSSTQDLAKSRSENLANFKQKNISTGDKNNHSKAAEKTTDETTNSKQTNAVAENDMPESNGMVDAIEDIVNPINHQNTNSDKHNSEAQNSSDNLPTSNKVIEKASTPALTLTTPIAGRVELLEHGNLPKIIAADQPIVRVYSPNEFRFISHLPMSTQNKLSVGKNVKFVVNMTGTTNHSDEQQAENVELIGQVSNITPTLDGNIKVEVHVLTELTPIDTMKRLKKGLPVQGKIDYGQIEVGTLVSKSGVHALADSSDFGTIGTDLSAMISDTANIAAPVKAYVWIVGHDRKLKQQIVDVISYNKVTKQYLVAGIPKHALICLVNLPSSAENKQLKIHH